MALPTLLAAHLDKEVGNSNYTVSGVTATIGSTNVSRAKLARLLDVAASQDYAVTVASGSVKLTPGRNQ